ncbi:MAG: winged helix-turn-helix domain-containing protein [Victivallaceae bacterium]|nr:winged helix-turn-helix domain-containing protein [Victivallaceae bacterium]
MNANEIHSGKDYIVKVGHNEVKVKVISGSDRGWVVKTAGGKFMPINNSERFIRPVEHAPALAVPAETATPAVPTPANNSDKKLSMLDAAAEILKGASYPMSAKEIIVAMEDSGIWKSPAGKTPHCTLSAGLNREITGKENPRFQKTGKGLFALAEQGGEPCAN